MRGHMTTLLVNSSSPKAQNSPAPACTDHRAVETPGGGIVECRQVRAVLNQPSSFPNFYPNAQSGLPLHTNAMTFLRTSAVVAAAGVAFLTIVPAQTMVGTWTEATVTDSEVNLLTQVAGNASYYAPDVTTAICLIAVEGLWTQTVAGTNYKFQVAGCAVNDASGLGPCVNRECARSDYDVTIFSQEWTNTLQVTSVTQHN